MSYKNRYEVMYRINSSQIDNNYGTILIESPNENFVSTIAISKIHNLRQCEYDDIDILNVQLLDSEYIDDEM